VTGIRQVGYVGSHAVQQTYNLDQCDWARDVDSRQSWHYVAFVTEQDVVGDARRCMEKQWRMRQPLADQDVENNDVRASMQRFVESYVTMRYVREE